jgi:hypothetical protein
MPAWEDHFHEAIETFRHAKLDIAASTLDHYRARVAEAVAARHRTASNLLSIRAINAWDRLLAVTTIDELQTRFFYSRAVGAESSLFERRRDQLWLTRARAGDHVATTFLRIHIDDGGGVLRIRLRWHDLGTGRRAHVWLQSENGSELASERAFAVLSPGGSELLMTARLPQGSHLVRLVATPVGENESVMPNHVEAEVAGGVQSEHGTSTSKMTAGSDSAVVTDAPAPTPVNHPAIVPAPRYNPCRSVFISLADHSGASCWPPSWMYQCNSGGSAI